MPAAAPDYPPATSSGCRAALAPRRAAGSSRRWLSRSVPVPVPPGSRGRARGCSVALNAGWSSPRSGCCGCRGVLCQGGWLYKQRAPARRFDPPSCLHCSSQMRPPWLLHQRRACHLRRRGRGEEAKPHDARAKISRAVCTLPPCFPWHNGRAASTSGTAPQLCPSSLWGLLQVPSRSVSLQGVPGTG